MLVILFKLFLNSIILIGISFLVSCSNDEEPQEQEIEITVNALENINFTIDENPEEKQKIGTIQGSTNKGSVSFSIIEQTPPNSFSLISNTGDIFVNDPSIYDYETTPNIIASIKVSNGDVFKNSTITITLNDLIEDVFEGDIELNTQNEVIKFSENKYREITGSLVLSKDQNNNNDPITDLTPLKTLETIGGGLKITRLEQVKHLEGLNNITSVDYIWLFSNPILEDISALKKLTSTNGISIQFNPKITSLDCFSKITQLSEDCYILENNSLLNLKGLENIKSIGKSLSITQNKILNNIFNLSSLENVGNTVTINNNPLLVNLNGLDQLKTIGGGLLVLSCDNLFDVNGLENLNQVGNEIYFNANRNLQSINLKGLTSIKSLQIAHSDKLQNLDGLSNLTSVNDKLLISQNDVLNNFCGLKNLMNKSPSVNYSVGNNLYNPTKDDIINNRCSM